MTDRNNDHGRMDLQALDEPHDSRRVDRVISAVMRRRYDAQVHGRIGVFATIAGYSRVVLAAAAVLIVVAGASTAVAGRRATTANPVGIISDWVQSQHVPTNGELLVAFQGYDQ